MTEHGIKIGKKGALKQVVKKLTQLRQKPLSKKVFEIVQDNYDRQQSDQRNKKIAKTNNNVEA